MQRGTIQLPRCSGVRSRECFLKLLSRVDPEARNGFGFEGSLVKPGAHVSLADLRPTAEYPEIPLILECSYAPAHTDGARRRADSLYVLWRWQPEARAWRELGRAASASWEWALDLRPLAVRALAEGRSDATRLDTDLDLPAIAVEIAAFLDKRLAIIKPADRARILGILHDEFAARLSA